MEDEPKYISPKVAARIIGVTTMSIYRYMKQEDNPLPHVRINEKNIKIKLSDLEAWMDSQVS